MERSSGILCPVTSLPSPHGIGTLGRAARDWVDFLHRSGQRWWQVLPIGPTSYGDSPYQPFSAFAGNPYFIDLDTLAEEGLLRPEEAAAPDWGDDPQQVDYGRIYQHREGVLRAAYQRAKKQTDQSGFLAFCRKHIHWLGDYALFMALKGHFDGRPWQEWEEDIRLREPAALRRYRTLLKDDIAYHKYLQYLFFKQWAALKEYAAAQGVGIIGDIPLYVSMDSADVWSNPQLFWLDEERQPRFVAGCPPDYFSPTGQLWGNPLYDWERMKRSGYRWWIQRLGLQLQCCDLVRIDHFRGFSSFWAIPFGDETAQGGHWETGPGLPFFQALKKALGDDLPLIAEDLGYLTPDVHKLLEASGFPGMKVLQFAFDGGSDNAYLPHNHRANSVVYIGTHDNDTLAGWFEKAGEHTRRYAADYLGFSLEEGCSAPFLRAALASVCDLCIFQVQDLLELGSEARMNTPSTTGGNWCWRLTPGALGPELAESLCQKTAAYGRLPAGR